MKKIEVKGQQKKQNGGKRIIEEKENGGKRIWSFIA